MRPSVPLAADGVTLHQARVRACLQLSIRLAPDCADAAERPRRRDLDVVPALTQSLDRARRHALLDREMAQARLARVERARERLGVMAGRVDRLLQVQPEV